MKVSESYKKKCEKCGYQWVSWKVNPKCCPDCKYRLGKPFKKRED